MKNKIEVYRADQILGLLVNPKPEQEIPPEATYIDSIEVENGQWILIQTDRLMVVDEREARMNPNKKLRERKMKSIKELIDKEEKIAELISEALRMEAIWSKRSVIPEKWQDRDDEFKKQMIEIVKKYLTMEELPTPEEAHNSWMKSYFEMGWKYGEKRDLKRKTHPDLIPYNELPKDEKDKDAIFLALVWLAKSLQINK